MHSAVCDFLGVAGAPNKKSPQTKESNPLHSSPAKTPSSSLSPEMAEDIKRISFKVLSEGDPRVQPSNPRSSTSRGVEPPVSARSSVSRGVEPPVSEPSGPTDEDRARALHEEILALQEQMLSVPRSQRAELSQLAHSSGPEATTI